MNKWIPKLNFKNIIAFTIAQKVKDLDVNLTKHVKELYAENYKIKETKKDLNIWRHIACP